MQKEKIKEFHELDSAYALGEIPLPRNIWQGLKSFLVAIIECGKVLLASNGKIQICSILQCTRYFPQPNCLTKNITRVEVDNR